MILLLAVLQTLAVALVVATRSPTSPSVKNEVARTTPGSSTTDSDTLPPFPYQQAGLPISQRVDDLLSRLSIDEMIGQTWHPLSQTSAKIVGWCAKGVGATIVPSGATPLLRLQNRNKLQQDCMNANPHGIPLSFHEEGLHAGALGGTNFPEPLLTACTWNESLASAIGAAIAFEARGAGVDNVWSPVVNMWTDDRFGRFQEGLSPDPTITSHMARSLVLGMQGGASTSQDYLPGGFNVSTWATAKHYAGYGSAAGGLNGGPFQLSNRTLFDWFLRPWRSMVSVGLRGAMPSHNTVLDVPMHGNRWLTRDVLRFEFGAGNISTVSDCNDISAMQYYRTSNNLTRNVALAMKANVDGDLQCGPLGAGGQADQGYFSQIPGALADGTASEGDLRELVTHILTQKFAAGVFDQPLTPEEWVTRLNLPATRALAYEAASQGIVLLQNQGGVLPLDLSKGPKKVAFIGPHMVCNVGGEGGSEGEGEGEGEGGLFLTKDTGCAARDALLGSYTLDDGAISVPLLPQAFNATFPASTFTVAPGCAIDGPDPRLDLIPAALAAAAGADAVIVALGDSLASCGEWADRDSLDLPGGQLQLLEALVSAVPPSTPIILVLINGRAATFGPGNTLLTKVSAVIEAWRPGEEGSQAILDIISGKVNPSGKLTNQWAQNVGQMGSGSQPWLARRRAKWVSNNRSPPDATDGRVYDPYVASNFSSLPLFRFGHGLSYTTFNYSSMTLTPPLPIHTLPGGGVFSGRGLQGYQDAIHTPITTLHVTVCNTGGVAGTEVVQVYSQDPPGDWGSAVVVVPWWKRLVGFTRVAVAAGGCETAVVPILVDDLAVYSDAMELRVQPGRYLISVGGRSDADVLQANMTLVA